MTRLISKFNAYQRSVTTQVLSSNPVEQGYEVELRDTVLYPEGGGQPADCGTVAGNEVLGLYRRGDDTLVHLLAEPADKAMEVEVVVDWERRYDHMQQHTAQHMLTAVAQDHFGWATTAFHLHPERSDIELSCPEITLEALRELEQRVNELIRKRLPVTCLFIEKDEFELLGRVRSRGLPEDLVGPIRLVDIAGVDLNTCGGTHVANTSEVQAIKLLTAEPLRGGTRLFYLAGARVIARLEASLERERALTERLSCGPVEHIAAVDRLLAEERQLRREHKALLVELAGYLGKEVASSGEVVGLHRAEADLEFLRAIALAARDLRPDTWALLTGGERDGVFVLAGPPDRCATVGASIADILQARGGGTKWLFQGKAQRLDRRKQALERLRQLLTSE